MELLEPHLNIQVRMSVSAFYSVSLAVAVAVCDYLRVATRFGVSIERVSRIRRIVGYAERIFTTRENMYVTKITKSISKSCKKWLLQNSL